MNIDEKLFNCKLKDLRRICNPAGMGSKNIVINGCSDIHIQIDENNIYLSEIYSNKDGGSKDMNASEVPVSKMTQSEKERLYDQIDTYIRNLGFKDWREVCEILLIGSDLKAEMKKILLDKEIENAPIQDAYECYINDMYYMHMNEIDLEDYPTMEDAMEDDFYAKLPSFEEFKEAYTRNKEKIKDQSIEDRLSSLEKRFKKDPPDYDKIFAAVEIDPRDPEERLEDIIQRTDNLNRECIEMLKSKILHDKKKKVKKSKSKNKPMYEYRTVDLIGLTDLKTSDFPNTVLNNKIWNTMLPYRKDGWKVHSLKTGNSRYISLVIRRKVDERLLKELCKDSD